MKIRSPETLWLVTNGMPQSYPSLTSNTKTDILIIGAGITGALIAYSLLKIGKHVMVVDRRDVANGSTAASTAMLQYEIDVPLFDLIQQRGITCGVSSYQNCEKAIDEIGGIIGHIKSDAKFEKKKSIYFANDLKGKRFLTKEFKEREKHGFSVKWLEKESIKKLGLKATAAIESDSSAVMDPYQFTGDLLKFCTEKGLHVFDKTDVVRIKEKRGKLSVRTDKNFIIEADHIIHCTGYQSTETLPGKIVNLKSTYAMASEAFSEIPAGFKDHIYWNTDSPYLYMRSTHDGRLIVGGGDEDFKNSIKRDSLLGLKEKYLKRSFEKYFPAIPFNLDYSWAGTFGETKDGLPYFGQPKPDRNEHYILGFGGNGIMFSVLGMQAIIPSLEGKPHPFLDYYRFER